MNETLLGFVLAGLCGLVAYVTRTKTIEEAIKLQRLKIDLGEYWREERVMRRKVRRKRTVKDANRLVWRPAQRKAIPS